MSIREPFRQPGTLVLLSCAAFMAANLIVPLVVGDVYPFTIAPMFRDAPRDYCNYRVYAPDGTLLADNSTRRVDPVTSPDPFHLRRYYDGNPTGLGVGIRPPETIDGGQFGGIHSEQHVRQHFQQCLANRSEEYVEVEQEIIGPIDAWRVGVIATNHFHIRREDP